MIGKEEAILVARTLGKETKFWPKQSFKAARSETGIYTVPKLLHTPLPLVICFLNYPPLSVALVRVNLMWEMCVSQEEHAQLEPLLMYIIVGLVKALADGHSMLRPDWALVDDTEEELVCNWMHHKFNQQLADVTPNPSPALPIKSAPKHAGSAKKPPVQSLGETSPGKDHAGDSQSGNGWTDEEVKSLMEKMNSALVKF